MRQVLTQILEFHLCQWFFTMQLFVMVTEMEYVVSLIVWRGVGCTGFGQLRRHAAYSCRLCDFDLCDLCYERALAVHKRMNHVEDVLSKDRRVEWMHCTYYTYDLWQNILGIRLLLFLRKRYIYICDC